MLKQLTGPPLKLMATLGNCIHPSRNHNPLVISGSPRSGTTWVAETVARLAGTRRLLWEPLQDGNPECARLNASKRPFISETFASEEMNKFFDDLLGGRQANAHLLRLRQDPRNAISLLQSSRLIIKFVRGNGIAAYLRRHFLIPKPLVIMRHPCAVVASQLNMGAWKDHPHVDRNLIEARPYLREVVSREAPLHQRLAMTWAGDVLAAREHPGEVHVIRYEDLATDGANTLSPILREWGLDTSSNALHDVLDKPSSTTHGWSDLDDIHGKLHRWQHGLPTEVAEQVLETVSAMGVSEYSACRDRS